MTICPVVRFRAGKLYMPCMLYIVLPLKHTECLCGVCWARYVHVGDVRS